MIFSGIFPKYYLSVSSKTLTNWQKQVSHYYAVSIQLLEMEISNAKGLPPKGFDANYYKYYGHVLHIKAHFAGDKRKSQGCNINSSSLSLSISHYLQIHRTEISFSDRHQGVNHVYTLKSIKMSSFSDFHKHYSEDITLR